MTNKKLAKIKEDLQKIAIDIETPDEVAAPENSPEAVMELVDDAIKILEVAEEAIPAENPEEEVQAPIIGAKSKTRKAQDEEEKDEDEKEKDAKIRKAQNGEDEDDDDEEKKELEARLKTVEAELDATKRAKLAENWIELLPDAQRQAKYDEIVKSEDPLATLERDFKVAKETYDATRNPNAYRPAKNETGYLFKKASQNRVQLEPWKV